MKAINKAGMFRKLALATFAFSFFTDLSAAPVSTNLAGIAALTWLQTGNRLGMGMRNDIGSVKTFATASGAAFNVVHLRNGGFVVTSNDTDIEPIIAFSGTSDFVENPQGPLWAMLDRDLAARARKCKIVAKSPSARAVPLSTPAAQWARLTRGASLGTELRLDVDYAPSADGVVSDVRVEPLLETKWSQYDPYNLYTPNRYPCGCVATATAQIMRYFRYPTGSVTPRTNTCNVQSGTNDLGGGYYEVLYSPIALTMQGGVYDWNNMPTMPDSGITDVQRMAIGKLTSDIGIACFMSYAEDFSGTGGYVAGPALTDVFGYANALPIVAPGGSGGYFPVETIKQILISNLDAKLPVLTSLDGPQGGHGAVADGYGYSSGTFLVHFNLGWGGEGDAWYAPPSVGEFTAIDTFVYNIYPDGKQGGVICSGRVTTLTGQPIVGVKVSVPDPSQHKRGECMTDENGVYALILSEGTYDVTASCAEETSVRSVTLKACEGTRVIMDVAYDPSKLGTVNNVYGFDFTLDADQATAKVNFNVNGGGVLPESRFVANGAAVGALPIPAWDGYAFDGWFTDVSGGTQVTASTVVTVDVTYYAHWTKLPEWYTSKDEAMAEARRTGKKVFLISGRDSCYNTMMTREACSDPALLLKLGEKCVLWYSDCDTQFTETVMYTVDLGEYTLPLVCIIDPMYPDTYIKQWTNGYMDKAQIINFVADVIKLYPEPVVEPKMWTVTYNANGGTGAMAVQLFASGVAQKLTDNAFTFVGHKFAGWATSADGEVVFADGQDVAVLSNMTLYAQWVEVITGKLNTAFAAAQTADGALYGGNALVGTMQVKVGKIGKKGVKVSGTATLLVDGKVKKVTAKTVNVMLDATGRVPPVQIAFKEPIGAMTFEMAADGRFTLKNASYLMVEASVGGALNGGVRGTFRLEGFDLAVPGELQEKLLPLEESFGVSGGKWSFLKAAVVKWAKDKATGEYRLAVDDAGGKTNLSGLKLTYTGKTGQFKGSFKAYALEGGGSPGTARPTKAKLLKYTVNVIGFVVDGVGHGEASCKKPAGGPWTVTVE